MKSGKNQSGFTLIELVLVISLIGILTVTALPSFIDVSTTAKDRSRLNIVASIRTGISNDWMFRKVSDPNAGHIATLDANDTAADCENCFANVLTQGIKGSNSDGWYKSGDFEYTFYGGSVSPCTFEYDPSTGEFNNMSDPDCDTAHWY